MTTITATTMVIETTRISLSLSLPLDRSHTQSPESLSFFALHVPKKQKKRKKTKENTDYLLTTTIVYWWSFIRYILCRCLFCSLLLLVNIDWNSSVVLSVRIITGYCCSCCCFASNSFTLPPPNSSVQTPSCIFNGGEQWAAASFIGAPSTPQ